MSVGEVATTALPEEPVSVEFPTVGEEVVSNAPKEPRFKKGDFVLVEEHAWEGVNNEGGFARILKAYEDEEEEQGDVNPFATIDDKEAANER